ncbi:MAG: hypothetical protein IM560_14750 [Pseudanabaena sp. M085S1SP2A07QC]|nr:hypothetical protein [Pseudanabaena sp. M085S1SP2A07QC]MCA6596734.1 hypothetical protein [Pseudanabaena sp. M046S1SP1A06QC]
MSEEYLKAYGLADLPLFKNDDNQATQLSQNGWLNGICGYFDAIEAMEFYVSLTEDTDEQL